ncbi:MULTISPECIES: DUF4892 domain-containing protein [Pseudomonas]|uniref:DUF4892 domain-containing protein n=1 Tax=Pseudomonas TaxID=286 RepID=UPI002499E234|nr:MULTISPECIES: DUF4892 domain-containing protein [Pseudomonas]
MLFGLFVMVGHAQAADVAGSHDLEILPRPTNAEIVDFRETADLERIFPQGSIRRISGDLRFEQQVATQGRQLSLTYELPAEHTSEQAFTQARRALQQQGGHLLYWCEERDCGSSSLWANAVFGSSKLYGPDDRQAYALVRLSVGEIDDRLVALYAITRGNRRAYLHVEQFDASRPLGVVLPTPATLLRQLLDSGELDLSLLDEGPQDDWVKLLVRSLNQNSGVRVTLSGVQAEQWRDALVQGGVRAPRIEVDGATREGLHLDLLR